MEGVNHRRILCPCAFNIHCLNGIKEATFNFFFSFPRLLLPASLPMVLVFSPLFPLFLFLLLFSLQLPFFIFGLLSSIGSKTILVWLQRNPCQRPPAPSQRNKPLLGRILTFYMSWEYAFKTMHLRTVWRNSVDVLKEHLVIALILSIFVSIGINPLRFINPTSWFNPPLTSSVSSTTNSSHTRLLSFTVTFSIQALMASTAQVGS